MFIQLWTLVDDDGRTRASSRLLASLLYPYDDDAPTLLEEWLRELEDHQCAIRYVVDNCVYLEVCNFGKHQKIDRPTPSKLPPSREGSPLPREDSRGLAPRARAQDREGMGGDLDGNGSGNGSGEDLDTEGEREGKPPSQAKAPRVKKPKRSVEDFVPNTAERELALSLGIDAGIEAQRFRDYCAANGKTYADPHAAFRNWLRSPYQKPAKPHQQTTRTRRTLEAGRNVLAAMGAQ